MNTDRSVNRVRRRTNWPITILMIIGCVTIFFPLYMTVIIAFKKPSEMTNDILGALQPPAHWSLSNFSEAMKVTNFGQTLGYSILITLCTVVLSVIIHSLAGYAVGRNMARKKFYKFAYFYMLSGMFVPFAILMMPEVKQAALLHLANWGGVIILYVVFFMPMNMLLYVGYLKNIPMALEEAAYVDGAGVWSTFWHVIFPNMMPMHA
ncbi:MAG TPA: ABC transporter permease, partial [Ruminococcaceae bacterium]|nr:ABC transporter permease [Oscillospiraceae bacterium]